MQKRAINIFAYTAVQIQSQRRDCLEDWDWEEGCLEDWEWDWDWDWEWVEDLEWDRECD